MSCTGTAARGGLHAASLAQREGLARVCGACHALGQPDIDSVEALRALCGPAAGYADAAGPRASCGVALGEENLSGYPVQLWKL